MKIRTLLGCAMGMGLLGCGHEASVPLDPPQVATTNVSPSAASPLEDPKTFGFVVHVGERSFYVISTDAPRSLGGEPVLLSRANVDGRPNQGSAVESRAR